MIKRIDLFMPPSFCQYGVLHHFTKKLQEAFQRLGVNCRLLEAQYNNPKPFLTELFQDPPECTLSFNGLLPDEEGRFFCDLIRIPHVAYVVDSPNGFVTLAQSPLTIIANVDRQACDFFRGINSRHVLFMPHGVEKNLGIEAQEQERPYEVLMLSSCIDYEQIRQQWQKKYPAAVGQVLDQAAEIALSDDKSSYVQAFVGAFDAFAGQGGSLDPQQVNFVELLDILEMYIRGRARVEMVRAIRDAQISIFGSASATSSWQKQLGKQSNVVVHDAVPYDQALELMQRSKIVLSSCAWIKYGLHERILAGLACGALVVAEDNLYLREQFSDGVNIALYPYGKGESLNTRINEYLVDETKRRKIVTAGREQVMLHHTWDHRAAALLKELSPILQQIRDVVQA
jgi:spore maturation protein CgeB